MALFNEILVGRYNRALQKLFALKGGPPAPQLASEITPSHAMMSGAENRYIEGWNRFGFNFAAAAGGAGNRSAARIRNPIGSNVIIVIEKIVIAQLTAADSPFVNIGGGSAGLTNVGVAGNTGFDNRGQPTGIAEVSTTTNVGALGGVSIWQGAGVINTLLEVIYDDSQNIPLAPQRTTADGSAALTIYCGTLNQALNCSIWWRERFLEDSERT